MSLFASVHYKMAALLVLVFALNACGGGGGDDGNPVIITLENSEISVLESTLPNSSLGALNLVLQGDIVVTSIDVSGDAVGKILISPSGQVSLASGFQFDYEDRQSYLFNITVNIQGREPLTATLLVRVLNVVEDAELADVVLTVPENSNAGTTVGNVIPGGVSASDFTDLSIAGDGADQFEINDAGLVVVAAGADLDFETKNSYVLSLKAKNLGRSNTSAELTVNINDVVEVAIFLQDAVLSVDEGSVVDTVVGSIVDAAMGASPATSFELIGADKDNFTVDLQGVVRVSDTATLDFDIQDTYMLTAQARNNAGLSNVVDVTINIADVELPPVLVATTLIVSEHTPEGGFIGQVETLNIGDSVIIEFTLSGADNHVFNVNSAGDVSVALGNSINASVRSVYNLQAQARNAEGLSLPVALTIDVDDSLDPIHKRHIVASDPELYDFAGNAVALLNNQLFVAAEKSDHVVDGYTYNDGGSVYLYDDIAGDEIDETILNLSDNSAAFYNKYGSDLSALDHPIHGDMIAVGVEGYSSCGGKVVLYKVAPMGNYYDARHLCLTPEERTGAGNIGHKVELTNDYILAGGSPGLPVFLFSYQYVDANSASSSLLAKVSQAELEVGDGFGNAISASGEYFVVAAHRESSDQGAAYVYKYNVATNVVSLVARIQADDAADSDFFGRDVSIEGNQIAVVNTRNDVYLFEIQPGGATVLQRDKITHVNVSAGSEGDASVLIKDDFVFAGVPGDAYTHNSSAGSVQIYRVQNNEFTFLEKLISSAPEQGADFGARLAFDGRYLAVSAPYEDNVEAGSGGTHLFDLKPNLKPRVTNYQSEVAFKDNADITNVFEFEVESAGGGPFEFEISGADSDKFIMLGNRLVALNPFDIFNPTDVNGDNDYLIIVKVTDSEGHWQEYSVNVSIWEHLVLYYKSTRISEIVNNDVQGYGSRMESNGGHMLVQESLPRVNGKNNFHSQMYHQLDNGRLFAGTAARLLATSLLDTPTHIEKRKGQQASLGSQYLGLSSLLEPINNVVDVPINSISLYKITGNEFEAPIAVSQEGDEPLQAIIGLEVQDDYLIASLGDASSGIGMINKQIFYRILDAAPGIDPITRIYTHTGVVEQLVATDQIYAHCASTTVCEIYNAENITTSKDLIATATSAGEGEGDFYDLHKNFVVTETIGLADSLSFYKADAENDELDFVASIALPGTVANADIFFVQDMMVAVYGNEATFYRLNLNQPGREHLDNIVNLGTQQDGRFNEVDEIEKLGDYMYFGRGSSLANQGEIYIFKMDEDI